MNQNKVLARLLQMICIGLVLTVFSSVGLSQTTFAPLVKPDEKNVFSFQVKKSQKIMTIAVSRNPDYIVYRFGTKNKIELEFPAEKKNSWDKFTYSWYFRGGGPQNAGMDVNYFWFANKGYTYEVYQEYESEEDKIGVGIRITNDKTNQSFEIEGDLSTVIGTLIHFRDNDKIRKEEAR
jgi:hypothetical protein